VIPSLIPTKTHITKEMRTFKVVSMTYFGQGVKKRKKKPNNVWIVLKNYFLKI
jgi:hypothetical protein